MAFTPSENPITHPTRESYTELRPFRFWCQKVLPLVYDNSLSYYELLCKVVDYLNKTMEDVDHMNTDMDTLYSNFQEFQEGTIRIYNELVAYVNAYFENLDVQEEINNKLDDMVTSGELVTILQPGIADEVSSWLTEHITPTTPAIDASLTVSGAGADAKVTGDMFKLAILNHSDNYEYTDANDINENCILFNSVTQGETELSNTPNYAGWIQTIITGSISTQIYYPYETNVYTRPISIRQKYFSGWNNWNNLSYKEVTQNKLPDIVSGNLNNYTDNCFLFVSAPHTVENAPETNAGVLCAMNFGNIVYQTFTSFVSKNTYTRFKFNEWDEWSVLNNNYLQSYINKIVIDITNNHTYTNANDINENCILFNSLTQGVTTVSNTPVYAGWLQTNVLGNFALQTYYPYESNLYTRPVSVRQKTTDGWSDWKSLSYKEITQTKLPDIDSGDANDYTTSCYLFINSPNTVENLPTVGAGVLSVLNFNTIIFQSFTSYGTKASFIRFRFFNTWSDWNSGAIIDLKDSFSFRNANDVNTGCILFNSFSSGSTVVSNTPNYAGWLQTYYTNSSVIIQVYYPIETNKNIKFRTKLFSNWSDWIDIGYSFTKNITENTISNTYNITTSPTITTDANGWLLPIDSETEDETNKTDMSGAIMSMLNSTGYCHLAKGIYYVSGSIDMPSGSTLIGCGKGTKIKLLDNVTNGYAIRLHTNSTIKDLCVSGSYSDIDITNESIGGRSGIYYVGNSDGRDVGITPTTTSGCVLENCRIERFNGYGVYGNNTGGNIKNGIIITDCHVYNCAVGVCFGYRCEYNKLANSIVSNCYVSVINNGGNNTFENCTIHGIIGMLMDNSTDDMPNNSHGSCNNCIFNHIGSDISATGNGIEAIKMNYGFVFNNCQFWYSKISLVDCTGFCFNGCLFSTGGVISATIKPLFLNSNVFMSAPVMSVPNSSKINACYLADGTLVE